MFAKDNKKNKSLARQNWDSECETALNKQIDLEYYASHYYHLLYCFFHRDTIGLENIAKYFQKASVEEREHAEKLMDYQTKRGGVVEFGGIPKIQIELDDTICDGSYVKKAFELALNLEKKVNLSLLKLHKLASDHEDPPFADFLESEYLYEQVDANYELSKYISQLNLIGNNGHGIWSFARNFSIE